MSNEKLGAEQGRVKRGTFAEIAANALGAAEMLNGPVVDATRVIEKVIQEVGPQIYAMAARAEQAYHARGAGRELLVKEFESFAPWIIQHSNTCSYEATNGPHGDFCDCGKRERVQRWREALRKLREPGADTGTTPPPDVWTCEACGYKSDDIGEYREVCGKCFSAAAERGTTPPEGLEFGLKCAKCGNGPIVEKDIHCEICSPYAPSTIPQACLDAIAKYCNFSTLKEGAAYLRELERAATQRAPVEQIQSNDLDRAHGFLRGRRMPLNMDENEAIHRDLAEQFRQVRATAPDHAREGALREALELAKGALANGSTIDQRYETYKIVCEALADGKEGGE